MNEYPKEVQDVLNAPPEPFEAYLHFYDLDDAGGWYVDNASVPEDNEQNVWRCTVTPIERVK